MLKLTLSLFGGLLSLVCVAHTPADTNITGWFDDERWGDLGDGTYANPVLNADYSDPDVIRVGDKYYMTCSEFHFMGMPVLESDDMVNWRIIARVHDSIDFPGYSDMGKYAGGTWAPAIRHHDGKFWIFVCTPGEGLFMTTAERPEGPWAPLHLVKQVAKWEDPCPFWDDNGEAYLGRSQHGAGPIILHRMSPDGKSLLDEGVKIYEGPVAEGTKLFKKDGYYYLSIPEGGVGTGWQTVLRSKDIYGPYEGRRVLETGTTGINGPHQGALVDTPAGEWWFYHFQSTDVLGRVTHLQPVVWKDGFPEIGMDYDGNGVGEPVKVFRKPSTGVTSEIAHPQTSDTFDSGVLGVQWQFNHNPDFSHLSMTENPGCLTITALKADKLRNARNQLTQKLMGNKGQATVKLLLSSMNVGDRAGLGLIGSKHYGIGVRSLDVDDTVVSQLYVEADGEITDSTDIIIEPDSPLYLRVAYDAKAKVNQFYYSTDGETFHSFGDGFTNTKGDWKGCRVSLFNYNAQTAEGGKVLFDDFTYMCDGPERMKYRY